MNGPRPTIALIGNPNTGKSSLFNALCGMHARVGNFPGVTVEKKVGKYSDSQGDVHVIDLPGTYSLAARSADEMVSVDVLLSRQSDAPHLDAVVVIVDASNIERNLYLFSQVRDLGLPTLLVLNMWDRICEAGLSIDSPTLSQRLGVPVIATQANVRTGIEALKAAIRDVLASPPVVRESIFPESFNTELKALHRWLEQNAPAQYSEFEVERLLLDTGGATEALFIGRGIRGLEEYLIEARQRLSAAGCKVPAIETKIRYAWIREKLAGVVIRNDVDRETTSDRLDRILTHRVGGMAIFALIMFAIFQAIYNGATPMVEAVQWMQDGLSDTVSFWIPPGPLRSLLVDGVIGGVGSVFVFLPQILLLFLFIGIMEDSGYMARAAFVMDKLMSKIGLSGKSFLPLMSSFACAVPGIMATRVIENRRDRMVTMLVAPLMSCSARFPVYFLMVSAFVPDIRLAWGWIHLHGLTLFLMHALGALIAIPVAWVLKRWFFPGQTPPFVMELPTYKWPAVYVVLMRVWERAYAFILRAGTLIFFTSVVVWALGYFPSDHTRLHQLTREFESLSTPTSNSDASSSSSMVLSSNTTREGLEMEIKQEGARLIENSFLGIIGKGIEPVVRPLGWDWKIGVAVLASFPAREVVVATLGTIYSLGSDVDETSSGLQSNLQAARWPDGRPVFTVPVAVSIMVFFALCAQCGATLMVIRRETNSWRWPLVTFAYMTLLAYFAAFLVYQIGSRLGGAS